MDEPQSSGQPAAAPPPPPPPAPSHGRAGAGEVIRWLRLLGGRERN